MTGGPGPAPRERGKPGRPSWWFACAGCAVVVGLLLLNDTIGQSSATYDEVLYMEVAARWWRTGAQESITRVGSPLMFWKLQQAPVLWRLDRLGHGAWIDDPITYQALLLPALRRGAMWVWLVTLLLTAGWAHAVYGPRAMALAAWIFALGPNLLGHGGLITMELPITACFAGALWAFWAYQQSGKRRWLLLSAAAAGLGFSCKFTAALLPGLIAAAWWLDLRPRTPMDGLRAAGRVLRGMSVYALVMLLSNALLTGFARTPVSETTGEHPAIERALGPSLGPLAGRFAETPLPQDWVGFVTQLRLQGGGGPSYLLGERRMRGWWYYYLVALAVKVPLGVWLLLAARAAMGLWPLRPARGAPADTGGGYAASRPSSVFLVVPALFLAVASVGSSRNYGVRYLLPVAPAVIVWLSGLAEGPRWARVLGVLGIVSLATATASVHPHELSFFNSLAGGPQGGRFILSDSNLDWGQGARALARLQREHPEYRDLTLYCFGATDPKHYGVVGRIHVIDAAAEYPVLPEPDAGTTFIGVSASLRWGPWGPPGFFAFIDRARPVAWTDDGTIAIYRTSDVVPKPR